MTPYYPKETKVLVLISELLTQLDTAGIVYCHWKSNIDLDLSFSAEGDLDVLIDRRQSSDFDRLVLALGFKRGIAAYERQFPGIEDYVGWDRETGKMVHLHVHYQLVLGANYVKGTHLPIERDILKSRRKVGPIMISAPEPELLVFVLRSILKIRVYDVLRNRGISKRAVEELDFLISHTDREQVVRLLSSYPISIEFFDAMIQALKERSPSKVYRLKKKLERDLDVYQRLSKFVRVIRPVITRWKYRLFAPPSGKKLTSGGLVIAAVGSDGSGKSSMIEELYHWLKPQFGVRNYHLGRPTQTPLSYVLLRVFHRVKVVCCQRDSSVMNAISQLADVSSKYLVAKDRVRLYGCIRSYVGQGFVAIVDRHPLKGIAMDGPSGIAEHLNSPNMLVRSLAHKTKEMYEIFQDPDILIVLKVSLEVASQRRPEDTIEYLTDRVQTVATIDTEKEYVIELDAESDHKQVFLAAKEFVWRWL